MTDAAAKIEIPLSYEALMPREFIGWAREFVFSRTGISMKAPFREDNTSEESLALTAWKCLPDSDHWSLLAHLFEKKPHWTNSYCRQLITDWVTIRKTDPWQNDLHRFWWRWKQHQEEFKRGIANAKPESWAQICQFCETWSANRPVMAPFCGLSDLILNLNPTAVHRSDDYQIRRKVVQEKEVIVFCSDNNITEFSEFGASRQLIWALNHSGLKWSLKQPWDNTVILSPNQISGVIFWSYRHRSHDFAYHAIIKEQQCIEHSIPVINSMLTGWDVRHSTILRNLKNKGVRCPAFQKFIDASDIKLPYPLILRVDGIHYGQQMNLVRNVDEANSLLAYQQKKFLADGKNRQPPSNLAIEYINVEDCQGHFHKYRDYVIGEEVIQRHITISNHWVVNFSSNDIDTETQAESRHFLRKRRALDRAVLAQAGQASGSDVTALDYAINQEGELIIWEANRLFKMNGDPGYDPVKPSSQYNVEKRAVRDRKLGHSILALIQNRLIKQSNLERTDEKIN